MTPEQERKLKFSEKVKVKLHVYCILFRILDQNVKVTGHPTLKEDTGEELIYNF